MDSKSDSLSPSYDVEADKDDEAEIHLSPMQIYNETREFEQWVGIIIPSIFTIVIIVGLLGNLLVIIVALNRQMRNSTNTLIIGLTCSDLLFLTLCIPFTAIDYASPVWVNFVAVNNIWSRQFLGVSKLDMQYD